MNAVVSLLFRKISFALITGIPPSMSFSSSAPSRHWIPRNRMEIIRVGSTNGARERKDRSKVHVLYASDMSVRMQGCHSFEFSVPLWNYDTRDIFLATAGW